MSDEVQKELIRNLPAIITAIGVIVGAWFSYRAQKQGKQNADAIEIVRTDVNDKMQQFITVSGEAEHAKGVIQGASEQAAFDAKGTADDPIHVKVNEEGE